MARGKQQYPDGHRLAGDDYMAETGRGIVVTFVEPAVGDRNVRVEFKATHNDAVVKPISGWLDATDQQALNLVRTSFQQRSELGYRVEVHRKYAVSRDILFDDLSPDQKVRDLAWVGPVTGAPPAAAQPPAQTAAAPQTAQPPAERPAERPAAAERPQQDRQRPGPRVAEGKPWEELNSDNSPNLGAYAVTAAVGTIDKAVELLIEGGYTPRSATIEFVATYLLEAADQIQAAVRPDGRSDRMDNSHTRARGILYTTLRWLPFPLRAIDQDGNAVPEHIDAPDEWQVAAVKAGTAMLRMGLKLSGVDWRQAAEAPAQRPRSQQQQAPAPDAAKAAIIGQWPDKAEFDAAHGTYTKMMKEGLAEDVKARVKAFKDEAGIGWPLTPDQYQRLIQKIQEEVRAAAAPPPCEHCGERPCVCADTRQPVAAGRAGPVCGSCGGNGCEACDPF